MITGLFWWLWKVDQKSCSRSCEAFISCAVAGEAGRGSEKCESRYVYLRCASVHDSSDGVSRGIVSQCSHWCGFSSRVDSLVWLQRSCAWAFPHSLHVLSLVWTRRCFFRPDPWLKLVSQWGHLYSLSPVWIRWVPLVLKYRLHSLQWKDLFTVCLHVRF